MTWVLRSARLEVVRLGTSSRWIGVVLLLTAAAYLAAGQVDDLRVDMGMASSAWDVHATLVNNIFYLTLFIVPAFLFLIGDSITADVDSHFTRLAITRAGDRRSWLMSKIATVVVVALVVQALLLSGSLALGMLQGKSLTTAPSELAQYQVDASSDAIVDPLFRPSESQENMAVRQIGAASYLWLASSAIGCLFLVLSIGRLSGSGALVGWLLFALLDRLINWLVHADWYTSVSPTLRLVESGHTPMAGPMHPQLSTSIVLFSLLFCAATAYGLRRVLAAEL